MYRARRSWHRTSSKANERYSMAEELDAKEIVKPDELLIAQMIQLDAVTQLLIEKGIITKEEFYLRLKQVQAEYQSRAAIRE